MTRMMNDNVVELMLRELQEHPDVTVTQSILCEGITKEELLRVEEELGCPLVEDVRTFFRAHNGIAIEWHWNKHPQQQHSERDNGNNNNNEQLPNLMKLLKDKDDPYREGQFIVGPLQDFLTPKYACRSMDAFGLADAFFQHLDHDSTSGRHEPMVTPIRVLGAQQQQHTFESEQEFRSQLRYFDFYARSTGVVLLYQHKTPDPLVLYRDTVGGAFHLETPVSLSQYLRYTIRHYGLRFRRDLLFHDGSSIVTKKTNEWPTGLEQVLEYCQAYGGLASRRQGGGGASFVIRAPITRRHRADGRQSREGLLLAIHPSPIIPEQNTKSPKRPKVMVGRRTQATYI